MIDTKGVLSKVFMEQGTFPSGWFTDPKLKYVTFDMKGNHHLEKWSFPIPGSGLMWLVYDNDNDHTVDSGKELFGTFGPDADWMGKSEADAWQALSYYDQPSQGGNGDGVIDNRDAIWKKLKLWEPKHCFDDMNAPCAATSNELFSLEEKGVHRISLVYTSSN